GRYGDAITVATGGAAAADGHCAERSGRDTAAAVAAAAAHALREDCARVGLGGLKLAAVVHTDLPSVATAAAGSAHRKPAAAETAAAAAAADAFGEYRVR